MGSLPAHLVVASHNLGKVVEIADLCRPLGISVVSAAELALEEPEETGETFAENAVLKARFAAQSSGLWALADDSGLCVEALSGDPGVLSARWAGGERNFDLAMERVEASLQKVSAQDSNRRASFVCALALMAPPTEKGRQETEAYVFEGRVEGEIVWPPRGKSGFGYDPIFQPLGELLTFGEMDYAQKALLSHRTKAFAQLLSHWSLPEK